MADLVISPLVDHLVGYLIKYLATQYELGSNINKKLEDVSLSLVQIQAVVRAAEDVEIKNEFVAAWLSKLQEAVYEAEDLLDEFEYRRLKIQAKNASQEKTSKVRDFFCAPKCFKRFTDRELLKKLASIQETLKKLAGERGVLLQHINMESSGWESRKKKAQEERETTSCPSEPGFFGREEVLKEIIPLLMMDEPNGGIEIPVVSVVGQGGFGKTTLVRQVFNQKEVQEHFEKTVWVYVSQSFDLKRVVRSIIESVSGNRSRAESLERLQGELKEVVGSKKFLLVLDDMWCDNEWSKTLDNWRKLLAPLVKGARKRGSRILVTSRDVKMKNLPGALRTFELEPLNVEECWSIIKAHAFYSSDGQIPVGCESLEKIGLQIATKVKGSPLAAKVVGGMLNDTREDNGWNKILNTELRDLGSVMEILKLSYRHLPPNLRKCFAYCSLFPKGYYFLSSVQEQLGRMWVAQGFIQPRAGESIDEAGRECFNYLLSRSFFQKDDEYDCVMHDLIHDLAQHVSQGDCLGFERDNHLKGKIPDSVRHISLFTASHLSHLTKTGFKFGNLRSLLVIEHNWPPDIWHFTEVFSQLRHVRVLHLQCFSSADLPDVVGDWIHLRYLHIMLSIGSERLPRSLSRLYHLQVFVIENKSNSLSILDYHLDVQSTALYS